MHSTDIILNLNLRVADIDVMLAALENLPFKIAAPVIENLRTQAQHELDRHVKFNAIFDETE